MSSVPTYPVRVEGRLDSGLSRGMWLVKWLLIVPHVIVLIGLWIAFSFASVGAFFAILFTGRYPRGLFDFNVGVLRWTWRVAFYAFAANGTDRYPPFSLHAEDYPASLSVEYPERLSRGLALVKCWLLAIPHYLVVGLFIGGGFVVGQAAGHGRIGMLSGLVGILVLIAVVKLLFTGSYPRSVFDFVMGMDRWVLRVAAYAALMTDVYPPFRLDQGPDEPGAAVASEAAPEAGTGGRSSTSGIVMTVFGSLGLLASVGLLAGGGVLTWADQTQRDSGGYLMSPSTRLSSEAYALTAGYQRTSDALEMKALADIHGPSWLFAKDRLGTLRIDVRRSGDPRRLFVGITRAASGQRYLRSADYTTLTGFSGRTPSYVAHPGLPPASPGAQGIWAAKATGAREVTVSWPVQKGAWSIVVMNADGSRGVSVDARLGSRLDFIGPLGIGLMVAGIVSAVGAGLLTTFGVRRLRRPVPAA
jgi:Domain of unknown function (DUF4389)